MHRSSVKKARNQVGKALSHGRRWTTVGWSRGVMVREYRGAVVEAKGSGAYRGRERLGQKITVGS